MRAQGQAACLPGVEVVGDGYCSAGAVRAANGPVLVESRGTLDGGLVDTLGTVDVVGGSVRGDSTQKGGPRAGVVRAEGLDNVVFDEGARRPAVDRKVTVAVGAEGSAVRNSSRDEITISNGSYEAGQGTKTNCADPGFHPLPPTKLPALPDHWTAYSPPALLV